MQGHDVMPWWLNYLLVNPIRRLFDSPKKTLQPVVAKGMTIIEPGCGMGYFSLPMARMIGSRGKLYCLDLDVRIINQLTKRAVRAGLHERIEARVVPRDDLDISDLAGQADLCAAINLVHEVPDKPVFFARVFEALQPGGRMLIVEPAFHMKAGLFEQELEMAEQAGFRPDPSIRVPGKMTAILSKPLN
jgi:ubiquinone/menaquinone biosynthesis C-methylase UbiE